MKDLIDRNKICYSKVLITDEAGFTARFDVAYKEDIDKEPSVNVEDVVHCKDCRHYIEGESFGICKVPGTPYGIRPTPMFYCACGEKK